MKQVNFISGAPTGARIADTSPKGKRLDPALVEKEFGAKPAGSSQGLDLFAVRESMERMLQSSGGRPSLEGAHSQVKIPKITSDWEKLEKLVLVSSDLKHKPSIGQMAAMVLHLALNRIPERELKEAANREFA
ncbi:MAG: hypothetical protein WC091_24855 [Sulfuricellaceae bacterium]